MVVGHDDINTKLFRPDDFFLAQAPTVHRHNKLRSRGRNFLHRFDRQPVPFDKPVRDEHINMLETKALECINQHSARRQTIDVIVTINRNVFLFLTRLHEPLDCRMHIWQQKWVMPKPFVRRLQKMLLLIRRVKTSYA